MRPCAQPGLVLSVLCLLLCLLPTGWGRCTDKGQNPSTLRNGGTSIAFPESGEGGSHWISEPNGSSRAQPLVRSGGWWGTPGKFIWKWQPMCHPKESDSCPKSYSWPCMSYSWPCTYREARSQAKPVLMVSLRPLLVVLCSQPCKILWVLTWLFCKEWFLRYIALLLK